MVTSICKAIPIRSHLRFHRYGDEEVRKLTHLHAREAGPRYAHNRQGIAIDGKRLVQDVRFAAEVPRPIAVAEYRHGISAGRAFILRSKNSSEKGPDAEHLEIISADELRVGELGFSVPGDAYLHVKARQQACEYFVAIPDVPVRRVGKCLRAAPVAVRAAPSSTR